MMLPNFNYVKAQKAANIMCHILVDEMKLQYPQQFQLIEHGRFVWLLAVMDDLNLGGSMNKYVHESTLHRLSTALDGLPVYLSNHSGLRYGVLLSEPPRLPALVDFPAELEPNVIPFGVGLSEPVSAHAKQIVNMIVVGAQDSGKSMFLRSLAHAARMHGSLLCLADPVLHTFNPDYWNAASVLPVARNKIEFLAMLQRLSLEIEKRTEAFRLAAREGIPPEDLDQYNAVTGETMPRVWLIADEANSFLESNAVKEALSEPARMGRKYGIHFVLAGHDWHEYTVQRALTTHFETRLCLRTSNDTTGKTVLDDTKRGKRTMQFRQPGRAILRLRGQYQTVQLYFVSPDREREWFSQIQRSGTSGQWGLASVAVETIDPIAELAESIRAQWSPELSKRAVGKLIGLEYAGSYTRKIDQVINYLTATTTLEEPLSGEKAPEIG